MIRADLVIKNIGQLLTMNPASGGRGDAGADPVAGLGLLINAAVAVKGERIAWVGRDRELAEAVTIDADCQVIDAGGSAAMPGLIDCHTHSVFAGSRAHEFARRISGASYEEILAAGGGIHTTVRATREASENTLEALLVGRLDSFMSLGVTTVEIKSGYGLDLENELKMLRVVAAVDKQHPIDLVPTFLGAHTLPVDYRRQRSKYVDLVVNEMIPAVAEQKLAKFCDVFCERGAFDLDQTRRVLQAGIEHGLGPKLHGEQLSHSGSVDLAVELGAASVDHLEFAEEQDAQKLAASDTVAVLLPGASYFLGKKSYAPGRMLCDSGCAVAISTDFNPGSCMSENLPLMLNMACIKNGIYPREALLGATRWAAGALKLSDELGSLLPGKLADILVIDSPDYRNLVYHFGNCQTLLVIKRGKKVFQARKREPVYNPSSKVIL